MFSSLRKIFSGSRASQASRGESTGLTVVGEDEAANESLTPEKLAQLEPYEDAILANETIEPILGTNLVKIKFSHSDPELAQKVANTLAEVFVNNNLARATAGSTKAEDILAREIANLQSKIKRDQETQFNYAKNKNLPLTTDPRTNLEVTRLATLSSQLLDAENETKDLKAKYEAASQPDSFSIPDVQGSKRIDMLRNLAADRKKDALLVIYTPEWPEVRKLEAQIKPIEDELAKAPTEIVNSMKRRYEAAAAKEQSLRRAYDQQKGRTTQQTRDQIDLLAITQDLETNKQYLNTLLQRQRELSVGQGAQTNDVTISTPSRLPKTPIDRRAYATSLSRCCCRSRLASVWHSSISSTTQ